MAMSKVATDAIEWIKVQRAGGARVFEDTAHACVGRVVVMLGLYGSKPESILYVIHNHGFNEVTLDDVNSVRNFVLEGV